MLRLAFDFIITWRETRTRPNAYGIFAEKFCGVGCAWCSARTGIYVEQ